MKKRRAVITGVGVVSPVGLDRESTFEGLLAGRSGVATITHFDPSAFSTRIAGELKGFDAGARLGPVRARKLDRFCQIGLVAAIQAFEDSGLVPGVIDPERAGVIAGSGIGGLATIEEQHEVLRTRGPGRITPFLIPRLMMNALSGEISIQLGLRGPNWVVASACASAAHAIGCALRAVQYDEADIVLTGGSEAAVTPLGIGGFCSLRAMSTRNDEPERASRPFDKDRDGFVMGEGGAILVVESEEHAKRRGARIYCELAGFGATADAHHITAPAENAEGAQRAMRCALRDGGIDGSEVDYVNAHGTSTPINDPNESAAIAAVLPDGGRRVAVNSTKSMIGHLLGASGAVEAAVCALSIARGVVHRTLNHEAPGEGCELDYVPEGAREMQIRAALSNSLGFGGHNCSLAFRRYR
jgi:3-oxoacyl-[acyl-carrier-protein] synthase II